MTKIYFLPTANILVMPLQFWYFISSTCWEVSLPYLYDLWPFTSLPSTLLVSAYNLIQRSQSPCNPRSWGHTHLPPGHEPCPRDQDKDDDHKRPWEAQPENPDVLVFLKGVFRRDSESVCVEDIWGASVGHGHHGGRGSSLWQPNCSAVSNPWPSSCYPVEHQLEGELESTPSYETVLA